MYLACKLRSTKIEEEEEERGTNCHQKHLLCWSSYLISNQWCIKKIWDSIINKQEARVRCLYVQ